MGAKAKLTPAKYQRIFDVLMARRAVPSDKALARELGCSVSAIYWAMEQIKQRMLYDLAVPRETKSAMLPKQCHDLERLQPTTTSAC